MGRSVTQVEKSTVLYLLYILAGVNGLKPFVLDCNDNSLLANNAVRALKIALLSTPKNSGERVNKTANM